MFTRHLLTTALVIASSAAFALEPPLAAKLKAPRGLSLADGKLMVAEGDAGRVVTIDAGGAVSVLVDGIAVGKFTAASGEEHSVGVSAATRSGDTLYYVVGGSLGTIPNSDAIYAVTADGAPRLIADLWAYESAHNTGGDTTPAGTPDIDSNPFDLIGDGANGLFVSDAGANAVFHVSADGEITPFAEFMDRDNPLAGKVGGPKFDQVPTGLATGPDGALYVTTLTGFPFPAGAARIYRMQDANSDGDALDDGETTVLAEGLTTTTDLAFAADGTLYVSEFSTDMLAQAPGRLVKVVDGVVSEVVTPLVSPTSLAFLSDGRLAISQEFAGIITTLP